VRVRALSFHAGYRCRGSGACCTAGWPIVVEPAVEERLRLAVRDGRLAPAPAGRRHLVARPGLPDGARAVLAADEAGRCSFLRDDRRCAVHAGLGEEALPVACRQFPRLVTLTPLGASVTLSHFCPTAADLLLAGEDLPASRGTAGLERRGRARIVEDPPAFPASWPYQGLDARRALPPLLRPGVLMTWAAHEAWEQHAVATFASATTPEAGLETLARQAERARSWRPADGDFERWFAACHAADSSADPGPPASDRPAAGRDWARRNASDAWRLVAASVPAPHRPATPPPEQTEASQRLVDPGWRLLAPPIGRWLAAKAFASWLALQGDGLRTTVLGLRLALGVLRSEATRACVERDRPLDAALLKEALRRADLLLLHLADPAALARRLSLGEATGVLASAFDK
jgi:Fe-S-cluster containining protein